MSKQKQANAIPVGTWPLAPGTYDPALDDAGIPNGAVVFGLFDEKYEKFNAPKTIPGLTKVNSTKELIENTYFVLNTSSGFGYVLVNSGVNDNVTVEMLQIPKPEIVTYKMKHEEFLFLGKEYSKKDADYGAIWGDFCDGGYEIIAKYRKNSYNCMVINHNNNPEYDVYSPGTIVEGIDEIPEGFVLTKFPAREYLVVTHEWVSTKEEATGENGLGQIDRYQKTVQIPDGYVRYDGPGCQIQLIEIENMDTEYGSRWENWVPIKKISE